MVEPQMIDIAASIAGKNALVTGGSKGIGKATVEVLARHGANVAFTYNLGATEAKDLVRRLGDRASCHALDLRDPASIARCFAEFEERWQRLDILVNNAAAGSATVTDYERDADRADDALFEINAIGAFKVCQEGLKLMQRQAAGGPRKLINVASVGGIQIFPYIRMSDSASKCALVHVSKLLAAELVHTDIDVFAICPGPTDTLMFRRSTLDAMSDGERRAFVSELPKGRLLDPEEVADIIAFLASDYARPMHGAVIDASMGLAVHPGLCTGSSALAAAMTRKEH